MRILQDLFCIVMKLNGLRASVLLEMACSSDTGVDRLGMMVSGGTVRYIVMTSGTVCPVIFYHIFFLFSAKNSKGLLGQVLCVM